jgi:3-oxoacyl-[acyl-carrier protein] reductase
MGSLKGKRAFVTGASQGIGAAIAEGLVDAGSDVVLHYFQSDATPRALAEKAKGKGQKALVLQADLRQEVEVKQLLAKTTEFLGGLDVLINNAGSLVARRKLEEVDMDFWNEVVSINMTTMMLVARAVVFLASEYDGFINGATLDINGGVYCA